jgi:hypothetical protein
VVETTCISSCQRYRPPVQIYYTARGVRSLYTVQCTGTGLYERQQGRNSNVVEKTDVEKSRDTVSFLKATTNYSKQIFVIFIYALNITN